MTERLMPSDSPVGSPLTVGIIGAGRMGRIRALSAKSHPECVVVSVTDAVPSRAAQLAEEIDCSVDENWTTILKRADVNSVVVATPHKFLAPITVAAIRAGKHIFCEKPMARNAHEAEEILHALGGSVRDIVRDSCKKAPSLGRSVVVGYTLRHHPAITRAKELADQGFIGEPFYVRGRYGHGGRSGYEKEWRGDRDLSGGGELLDQGVHLIDLSRWFLGEFQQVTGFLDTYYWMDRDAPGLVGPSVLRPVPGNGNSWRGEVEDNAFMLMRTSQNKTAMLHVSWTQWKNMFSFEVFGGEGFLIVEGLGGSYGPERLFIGRRSTTGGVPQMEEIPFEVCSEPGRQNRDSVPGQHAFWDEEWAAFVRVARNEPSNGRRAIHWPAANAVDGVRTLKVVDAVYLSATKNIVADLDLVEPCTSSSLRR